MVSKFTLKTDKAQQKKNLSLLKEFKSEKNLHMFKKIYLKKKILTKKCKMYVFVTKKRSIFLIVATISNYYHPSKLVSLRFIAKCTKACTLQLYC